MKHISVVRGQNNVPKTVGKYGNHCASESFKQKLRFQVTKKEKTTNLFGEN
jgi:hypothetical protein